MESTPIGGNTNNPTAADDVGDELVQRFVDALVEAAIRQVDTRYIALFNATYELFNANEDNRDPPAAAVALRRSGPRSAPYAGSNLYPITGRPMISVTPRRLSALGIRLIDAMSIGTDTNTTPTPLWGSAIEREREIDRITTRFIPAAQATTCSICLDDIKNEHGKELPCKHLFHTHCVDNWLMNEKVTCPMCRVDIRDFLT